MKDDAAVIGHLASAAMNLTIRSLSKTYPNGVQALKDVSLTIPQGMFGLLGPNGAGKSTLMRTLATLQEADSGSAFLGEIDMLTRKEEVRRTLGYLPQEFGVYPKVSAYDLLDHFAVLKWKRCFSRPTCGRPGTSTWAASPEGCGSDSASPSPFSPTRASSSWTSRRPASIPRSGSASSTC